MQTENDLEKIFIEKWIEIFNRNINKLKDIWNNKTKFTSFILYDDESLIKQLCSELNLEVYSYPKSWYGSGVDALFYNKKDRINDTGNETWLTRIRIGFEQRV